MSDRYNARHESDIGEVEIRSQYNLDRVVFRDTGDEWKGKEGIRRFHAVLDAVRDAEIEAIQCGIERALAAMRRHIRDLESKGC